MNRPLRAIAIIALAALSGCVTPVGPVQVTRFHLPDTQQLAKGSIAIEPAVGEDGSSLEFRSYGAAVAQQLSRIGYSIAVAGSAQSDQVAVVSLSRAMAGGGGSGSPVSVGVGGSTGSYGSGVGLGIGVNLSGRQSPMVETQLAVSIRDRASGRSLWEGRASFSARASAPASQTQLGAARLAEALFRGFPGESGETILVQ